MNIAIIGNLTFDDIYFVNQLPSSKRVSIIERDEHYFGGRAVNIASVIQQLGMRTKIFSVAGDDFVTSNYPQYLEDIGVDFSGIKVYSREKTARFLILKNPNNNFISLFQPNVEKIQYDNLLKIGLDRENYDIVCLARIGSNNVTRTFLEKLSCEHHKITAISMGPDIHRSNTDLLSGIIKNVKYLFLNHSEAEVLKSKLFIGDIGEVFTLSGVSLSAIVVTRSNAGSLIFTPNKKEPIYIPVVEPAISISELGAGDAYVGGFLYGLINKWELEKCGFFASVVASFLLEVEGAQNSLNIEKVYGRFSQLGLHT